MAAELRQLVQPEHAMVRQRIVHSAIILPEEQRTSHALSPLLLFDSWWPNDCAYVMKGLIITSEEQDGYRSHDHP